uniref:F-box domain-containing protein n=1 Tax=Panagrolaimus davidi TaxID=227884 RepID=A0A914P950_9BILA
MLTFNTDGMVPQHFAFKDPIMDYVFKNLKPEHLIKLYQCCKYFYAKFRRNIIRHLEIVDDEEAETLDPTGTKLELCDSIDWKEYVTLTKSGTVKELKLLERIFTFSVDYTPASVEQLLGQVPNAKSVD